jgi:hypothetical protein
MPSKIVKIQFEMPEEKLNQIKQLAERGVGPISRKELFNNALTLLQWALKERAAGRIIASIDEKEKKIREIILPILTAVPFEQDDPERKEAVA